MAIQLLNHSNQADGDILPVLGAEYLDLLGTTLDVPENRIQQANILVSYADIQTLRPFTFIPNTTRVVRESQGWSRLSVDKLLGGLHDSLGEGLWAVGMLLTGTLLLALIEAAARPENRAVALHQMALSEEAAGDLERILNDPSIPTHRGEAVRSIDASTFMQRMRC